MNVTGLTHPDWEAFCDALAGEEYCNIKKVHSLCVVNPTSGTRDHYWRKSGQKLMSRRHSNCSGIMPDAAIAKSC